MLNWNWTAFFIGCFGAGIMEFIRIIRANKILTEVIKIGDVYINRGKINIIAICITLIYIQIGGAISGIFATTLQEAFIYGALWEALFTFVININNEKNKK